MRASPFLLLFPLAACARTPERWISLAEGAPASSADVHEVAAGGRTIRLVTRDGEPWLEAEIEQREWRKMSRPDRFGVLLPFRSRVEGDAALRLTVDGRELPSKAKRVEGKERESEPDTFGLVGPWLTVDRKPGEPPPRQATVAGLVQRSSSSEGAQRVDGRRFSGTGLSVWPGERAQRTLDIPPGSVLRFATCVESLLAEPAAEAYHFRVRLDDRLLLDHEQHDGPAGSVARHELELPAEGVKGARLEFEVSGVLASTSFLEPVIAPRAPEPRDARRPDIVVFVADTLRADNLAAYGSTLGITPNLDALAQDSLCFTQARSAATFTLPSHAALFSGLPPYRVAIDSIGRRLPEGVETIAERLSQSGYRTGAITGALFVSRGYGMSQGFQWFDELEAGMESTQERVNSFLAADDGRPVFLFVHTYRAHLPYEARPETRARLGQALGCTLERDFATLHRELKARMQEEATPSEASRAIVRELRGLYLAGVAEFDQEFGGWLAEPLVRRQLERSFFFFTSDHGEAFLEHDQIFHGVRVYDEELRVPLLVHGPGLEPKRIELGASLLDLAPTLAQLAGIPRSRDWPGTSLLELREERPTFAFECRIDRPPTVSIVAGEHKLIGLQDAETRAIRELFAAYDLGRDPGETHNLAGAEGAWPAELYQRLLERSSELLDPLVAPEDRELDEEHQADLRALGY